MVGHYKRTTVEDAKRWANAYHGGASILRIAEDEGVDPGTISSWLHRLGVGIARGHHVVRQPPLNHLPSVLKLISGDSAKVTEFLRERVWGIQFSETGIRQLVKFHTFIRLHEEGKGVEEISRSIGVHRSTVLQWRKATDEPYLVKLASAVLSTQVPEGRMLIPLSIEAGGNGFGNWVVIPRGIKTFEDIEEVVQQLQPLNDASNRAPQFGIATKQLLSMRLESLAYLLGMMLGDAGKRGGVQERFTSMSLDLQL